MIIKTEILQKANVLRQYENYGYNIAYYLLGNEALAIEASTQALVELFQADDFFYQSPSLQKQITKQVFIKQ